MFKRIMVGCFLSLCACMSLATAQESDYRMTKDEMIAVWRASSEKMNTQAQWEDGLADLEAYEARIKAEGGEIKQDMVISSLPKKDDMPYEEALEFAYAQIIECFGTPCEELEAMGVYPRLLESPYTDEESEWEFYITPRRDCEIALDHDYEAPGEYLVEFGAQSGEVDLCIWYIDDFWPYAQRTWDAGKRDYVYKQAQKKDFGSLEAEERAYFIALFERAGYDLIQEN